MHLPIKVAHLFHSNVVESDRLEFKADWNPEKILRTICAFANDFHNLGGGYLVIGVEEKEGVPVLPPKGVDHKKGDSPLFFYVQVTVDRLTVCFTPSASKAEWT